MYSPQIRKLIDLFSKFPTVGPRTAARFVFYLLSLSEEKVKELTSDISKLKENVKLCDSCFKSFEPSSADRSSKLCEICRDPGRRKELLCIVEKETDLIPIEKTKKYRGLYFILGGTVSVLKKEELKKLRIGEFLEKVKDPEVKEVIIALNPTTEGEATALYLERQLKPLGKKTTRLGRGLPMGAELEYADDETLSSALESRR
jgi:recombination protein RecR